VEPSEATGATYEELMDQAEQLLREASSMGREPLESLCDERVALLDRAFCQAQRALYKTPRNKSGAQKARALVVFAVVHMKMGLVSSATAELNQARVEDSNITEKHLATFTTPVSAT